MQQEPTHVALVVAVGIILSRFSSSVVYEQNE